MIKRKMKFIILIITIQFTIWTVAQICQNGCKVGPLKLPKYICRCQLSVNSYFTSCIKHCLNDALCRLCYGDPYFGFPKLCNYTVDYQTDLTNVLFKLTLKDIKINGFETGKANENTLFDPLTLKGIVGVTFPVLKMTGKYDLDGNICGNTNIKSKGIITITFEKLDFYWNPNLNLLTKCNGIYFALGGPTSVSTLTPSQVKFEFKDNINPNDTTLTQCANDNSNTIFNNIQSGIENMFLNIAEDYLSIVANQVPASEIFRVIPVPISVVNT